jgi:hypothetical protein
MSKTIKGLLVGLVVGGVIGFVIGFVLGTHWYSGDLEVGEFAWFFGLIFGLIFFGPIGLLIGALIGAFVGWVQGRNSSSVRSSDEENKGGVPKVRSSEEWVCRNCGSQNKQGLDKCIWCGADLK